MDAQFPEDVCAICVESMRSGEGKALFKAECSHTFHFDCIASSVSHGNRTCPTCRATWNHLPFLAPNPTNNPVNSPNNSTVPHPSPSYSSSPGSDYNPMSRPRQENFADDEPISNTTPVEPSTGEGAGELTIKAVPGYPAVSQSESKTEFPVLVSLRAPALGKEMTSDQGSRAPVDLVAVLDVSGSMYGAKLNLLKKAMHFMIENLSPRDRLSIVSFSDNAWRLTALKRMSGEGQSESIAVVDELDDRGSTNIITGLKVAIQVLEQRRVKNNVASIILLSDGEDNCNGRGRGFYDALRNLSIPPSVPIHTFGFGSDHDAAALHAVSEVSTGGTFSFVESVNAIKQAFAQCIGGLLSVVSQQVEITVNSGAPRVVKIESVSSGRYKSELDQVHGSSARIHVGDMYAEERKHFLVYLTIPPFDTQQASSSSSSSSSTERTQLLLDVTCSYSDALTKKSLSSETNLVEIRRPEELTPEDRKANKQVEFQRNRMLVAETIGRAQAMAEEGDFEEAGCTIRRRTVQLQTFIDDIAATADDEEEEDEEDDYEFMEDCADIQDELVECCALVSSKSEYETRGRGYILSGLSAHAGQRAAFQASKRIHSARSSTGGAYTTTAMQNMVAKAQEHNNDNPSNVDNQYHEDESSDSDTSDHSSPKRSKFSARSSTGGVGPAGFKKE